jgi:hypothetical protein
MTLRQRRPVSTTAPSGANASLIYANETKEEVAAMSLSSSSFMVVTHLYCIIWCFCIFLPIIDTKLFEFTKSKDVASKEKFMVAMDHRPLVALDFYLLVPLNGAILLLYITWNWSSSKLSPALLHRLALSLVWIAHCIDTIIRWIRMPFVWDHEQWGVLCNAVFIACFTYPLFLSSKMNVQSLHRYWLNQSGYVLGLLYLSAAFWKLTTGFWNVPTSCGSSLILETIVTYWLPKSTIPYEVTVLAANFGPHLAFGLETALAVGMITLSWSSNVSNATIVVVRNLTVLSAAFFHLIIYMLPVNAAGGFSLECMSRLVFFFHPTEVFDVFFKTNQYSKISRSRMWLIMTFLWTRYKGTGYLPDAGFMFYCLLFDLYLVLMFRKKSSTAAVERTEVVAPSIVSQIPFVTTIPVNAVVLLSIVYGFGLTILGIEQIGASTMYSNLRSYYGGNHLLVPTGILGDDILYGGGLVQVVHSTCDPLNKMLGFIDSSDFVPEPLLTIQRSLQRNSSIPKAPVHSDSLPMQFLPLCIGNPHSGKLLMDLYRRSNPLGAPAPFQFVLPISAVKTAIRIALTNGESFVVKLVEAGSILSKHIPALHNKSTPLIVLDESGRCLIEHPSVTEEHIDDVVDCSRSSFAQRLLRLDEPPSWRRYLINKFLLPYPQIAGEPDEVCMS